MWAEDDRFYVLLKFVQDVVFDEYRKRDADVMILRLAAYGDELHKMGVQNEKYESMWALTLVHCLRNPFSQPRFDVSRKHAEYAVATMRNVCFFEADGTQFAASFLSRAIRRHLLKEIDPDTLRFTTEGFQFIYPFTRGGERPLDELRGLAAFRDFDEQEDST